MFGRCNKTARWVAPNGFRLCADCATDYPWQKHEKAQRIRSGRCDRPTDGLGAARWPRGGRVPKSERWRGNPAWKFWRKPRPKGSDRLRLFHNLTRQREEVERALQDAKRLPISRGMVRGAFVEIRCSECHVPAIVEPGRLLDVNHRGSCRGACILVQIHAKRPAKGQA